MTSPVTILLLDDEPILRAATALMLERRGGKVTTARTAEEAVELARRNVYDVAILDVVPGGPSATEVLGRIRAEAASPRRVVAISNAPLDRREAEQFGTVLTKPYPFEHLLRAVFGDGRRRRTKSGVFPKVAPPSPAKRAQAPAAPERHRATVKPRGSRTAARSGRDRGG
jgi:DNA-binding response OmpR family regulator